jgi:hypothetical protein
MDAAYTRPACPAARRLVLAVAWGLLPVLFAGIVGAAEPSAATCAAARDRDLRALAEAAAATAAQLDADAAVEGAPEYELQETREAQMGEFDRARRAAQDRYRQCLARQGRQR